MIFLSNKKGVARSKTSAKKIVFSERLTNAIKNKVRKHNMKHPTNMVHTNTAKPWYGVVWAHILPAIDRELINSNGD